MKLTKFSKEILKAISRIPRGKVTTYKEIAKFIGQLRATRAVGNALGKNPYAPKLPCHRVVKSDGLIGGYAKGRKVKAELLASEGVEVKEGKIVNFNKVFYKFRK